MVTIGIDTHKATLAVSAIDPTGRELGAKTFPNDRQGHDTEHGQAHKRLLVAGHDPPAP